MIIVLPCGASNSYQLSVAANRRLLANLAVARDGLLHWLIESTSSCKSCSCARRFVALAYCILYCAVSRSLCRNQVGSKSSRRKLVLCSDVVAAGGLKHNDDGLCVLADASAIRDNKTHNRIMDWQHFDGKARLPTETLTVAVSMTKTTTWRLSIGCSEWRIS